MAYSTELSKVLVTELFADVERNFRDPSHDYASCQPTPKYDHTKFMQGLQKQGMFESIYYDGLKVPIWVALLTADQATEASDKAGRPVKYRVIRGHRRAITVDNINKMYPGHIIHVPAIIYDGLTMAEEWSLMADHGGVNKEETLSELGLYRACIKLFATSQFSQDIIGRMLGETRGWAMRRIWINKMGAYTPVEREYLKRFDPEKYPVGSYYSFTYKDVEDLHKAFSADEKAKVDPNAEGSEFAKKWSHFAATGAATPAVPKALTRQKIDERNSFVVGRPALEEMMKFASGRGGSVETAAEQYDKIQAKASKADTLASTVETLTAEKATLASELESALARVAELEAEIAALKAEKAVPVQASGQSRKGR